MVIWNTVIISLYLKEECTTERRMLCLPNWCSTYSLRIWALSLTVSSIEQQYLWDLVKLVALVVTIIRMRIL